MLPAGNPLEFCHEYQIFPNGHICVERRNFRQVSNAFLRLFRFLQNIITVYFYRAAACGNIPCHNVHRRGLTCAVGSQKSIDLPFFHRKRQIIHRCMYTVSFYQVLDLYQNKFLLLSKNQTKKQTYYSGNRNCAPANQKLSDFSHASNNLHKKCVPILMKL